MAYIPVDLDKAIQSEVHSGERILWTGQPSPSRISSAQWQPGLLLAKILAALVMFAAVMIVIWSPTRSGFSTNALISIAPLLAIPFLFIVPFAFVGAPFRRMPKDWAKQTVYAVTNKRGIILTKLPTLSVSSFWWPDVRIARRTENPDGTGDIIFSRNGAATSQLYDRQFTGGPGNVAGAMFEAMRRSSGFLGIESPREVEELISQQTALADEQSQPGRDVSS